MYKIPLLDLSRQYQNLEHLLSQAMLKVGASTQYIMGPEVQAFEKEMADYLGCKHAISCANGTDALVLSLKALGVGPGDEVITTPFTFFATAEAISMVGAVPVFVDVRKDTYNMDVTKVEAAITAKTKAIMPVHIFGQPVEMDAVKSLAARHQLMIIEDACQAIGAEYKGEKAGTMGHAGCFSFFPTKNLGAFGDGGMVVTNDDETAQMIRGLRVHGSGLAGSQAYKILNGGTAADSTAFSGSDQASAKYYNYLIGYNSRLDEIQAAILRVKLNCLDGWNESRVRLSARYNEKLKSTSLSLAVTLNEVKAVNHLYVVKSEKRNELASFLLDKGISTGVYYPVPLHLQIVYQGLGYAKGDLPVSEYLSERTLALPVYPELTEEEQDYIIDCIIQFESGN
jgi:dTDP-4-amino-4,6-dideoxygalactose transaminase